jgi:hypothetical protein
MTYLHDVLERIADASDQPQQARRACTGGHFTDPNEQ